MGVIRNDIAPLILAAIILATSDCLTTKSALPDATDVTAGMRALEILMTVSPAVPADLPGGQPPHHQLSPIDGD